MVVVWGLANHFGLNVLVMRLTALDPSRRGTIMGLNSAVTYFAVFVGTTGFGPLYTGFGFAASAIVAAAADAGRRLGSGVAFAIARPGVSGCRKACVLVPSLDTGLAR